MTIEINDENMYGEKIKITIFGKYIKSVQEDSDEELAAE